MGASGVSRSRCFCAALCSLCQPQREMAGPGPGLLRVRVECRAWDCGKVLEVRSTDRESPSGAAGDLTASCASPRGCCWLDLWEARLACTIRHALRQIDKHARSRLPGSQAGGWPRQTAAAAAAAAGASAGPKHFHTCPAPLFRSPSLRRCANTGLPCCLCDATHATGGLAALEERDHVASRSCLRHATLS